MSRRQKRRKRDKREQEKRRRRRSGKEQEKNIKKKQLEDDHKKKSLAGMEKKEEKEKSWQGHKVAEFKKEMRKEGDGPAESSDDDDAVITRKRSGRNQITTYSAKIQEALKKHSTAGSGLTRKSWSQKFQSVSKFSKQR